MNYYGAANDFRQYLHTDTLIHFGILGMKWGVRRYQNKDGSLTDAGRKRYNDSNTRYTLNDYIDLSSKRPLNEKEKTIVINKLDSLVSGIAKRPKSEDFEAGNIDERTRKNIDLGLKTLYTKDNDWIDDFDGGIKNKDLQYWWLYEDQTIGEWQIADMINKGWSKTKVLNTINSINKGFEAIDYGFDNTGNRIVYANETVWELSETYKAEQLVDDMFKVKEKEKQK